MPAAHILYGTVVHVLDLAGCCFPATGRLPKLALKRRAHVIELAFEFRRLGHQVCERLTLLADKASGVRTHVFTS